MKKIAIDLDGVVFDSENLYRVYTEIYDTDVHKKDTIINNKERTFQKRYNWPQEEFKKFYEENREHILKTANLMTGAEIILNKLKNDYELIVVTARDEMEANIAKEKFKELGLEIKVFYNEHSKIEKLLEEHADYMIDDDETICRNAGEYGICALYFKNNASPRIEKNNVINVNNWGEIYKYIKLYGENNE